MKKDKNVTSYADDTTPHLNRKNVATVLENIKTKAKQVFNWFSVNYLKGNPGKSQLLLTSKDEASVKIDNTNIKSSYSKIVANVRENSKKIIEHWRNVWKYEL